MLSSQWLRYGLYALAIVAGIWALRQALSWRFRARINRCWRVVARRRKLQFSPYSADTLPRLEGRLQDWTVTVATERPDGPGSALQTHFRLELSRTAPVKLRLSRAGPLSILGDLARSRFVDDTDHGGALSRAEGDPARIRDLVTGPLRSLVSSFDDWTLLIEDREVELRKPGITDSSARIEERLELLCAVARNLEGEESEP